MSCMLVMGENTYKNRFLDTLKIVDIELKIQGRHFVTFSKCQNYTDGEQTCHCKRLELVRGRRRDCKWHQGISLWW